MGAVADSSIPGTQADDLFWFEDPSPFTVTDRRPGASAPVLAPEPVELTELVEPAEFEVQVLRAPALAPAPETSAPRPSMGDTAEFTERWTEAWSEELRSAQERRYPPRTPRSPRQKAAIGFGVACMGAGVLLIAHSGASASTKRHHTPAAHHVTTPQPALIAVAPHSPASAYARTRIPTRWLRIYWQAGNEYGLDWTILAAVGTIESQNGSSTLPGVSSGTNAAGAAGPAQFENSTWARYGVNTGGKNSSSPYNAEDAVLTMAAYLKASGAPQDWTEALYAYNHSTAYGQAVLALAARYRG